MHPDKNPNADQNKFKEITAAYNLLSNAEKRKQYDKLRSYGTSSTNRSSSSHSSSNTQNSNGFNSNYQNPHPGSSQQGKYYQKSYYNEANSQKARKDFEEFYRTRYGGYRTGYDEYSK